jgi:hypothetical protein
MFFSVFLHSVGKTFYRQKFHFVCDKRYNIMSHETHFIVVPSLVFHDLYFIAVWCWSRTAVPTGGPWRNLDIICNFYVYYTVSLYDYIISNKQQQISH